MRSDITIHMVGVHAEGEVGNVILGGVAPPPGASLWEQRDFLHRDGALRDLILNEPRGGVFTHANLVVPAKHPEAAFGFLIMEPEHSPPMSGSNAICVATALLDTGMIPMVEPETHFTLEAPAGMVAVTAYCKDGKARSVEVTNVLSFADRLDAVIEVDGLGSVTVDTAFGGDSFVLINARDLGFGLRQDEARDIAETGARITRAANEQLGFQHPTEPWNHISFCQFTGPLDREHGILSGQSAVVIDPGKVDRSPTGTGCSARMAVLAARGEMAVGDRFIGRSILNSRFECAIKSSAVIGNRPAIIPTIRGRAWITGIHQILRDPEDPWPRGYRLTDTWPKMQGRPG